MQATKLRVISSDDHMDLLALPPGLFVDRAPAEFRDAMPKVIDTPDGKMWVAEGQVWGPSGRNDPASMAKNVGYRPSDPLERLKDVDQDGVYCQVIYGPPGGFQLAD